MKLAALYFWIVLDINFNPNLLMENMLTLGIFGAALCFGFVIGDIHLGGTLLDGIVML